MRNFVCLFFISFVLSSSSIAKGQLQPGMIDMTPSINATINNSINSARTRILMNNSRASTAARAEAAKRKSIEDRGTQVINAGRASLKFDSSYAGTVATVKGLNFDSTVPPDEKSRVQYLQKYVGKFNQLMTGTGYQVNNLADAKALSYALAYASYYDKMPSKNEIEDIRTEYSQMWISQAYFQGLSNTEKQFSYELWAVMSVQAAEQREKARKSHITEEREQADAKAKRYAQSILDNR